MGTAYNIYKDYFLGELNIDEMSNRLTLNLFDCDNNSHSSKDMTPEELAKVFLKGLTVCSYWMSNKKLKQLIVDTMYNDFGEV